MSETGVAYTPDINRNKDEIVLRLSDGRIIATSYECYERYTGNH